MKNKPKRKSIALTSFLQSGPKGFMRDRFFALLIDIVVVVLLCWSAFILLGKPDWQNYFNTQDLVSGLPATDPLVIERMRAYDECFIISLLICVVYESLTLMLFGASIGKLVFGFRVVNANDSRSPVMSKVMLFVRALLRALSLYLLVAIPFIFLCLTSFGNEEKRSGFDIFTGTKVIRKEKKAV